MVTKTTDTKNDRQGWEDALKSFISTRPDVTPPRGGTVTRHRTRPAAACRIPRQTTGT